MPFDPRDVLPPGTAAPDFALPDAQGRLHALSAALARGPVLLAFFKITCPTCEFTLPFLDRLYRQLRGSAMTIWAVSQDPPRETAQFNREFGITLPNLFDSDDEQYAVSDAYGLTHVPSIFLVEPNGVISHSSVGFNLKELEEISSRLAELSGRPNLKLFEAGEDVPLVQPGCASKN